jgi:putative selenate reductase
MIPQPYRDKFTLFFDRESFDETSKNQGFLPLDGNKVLVRLNGSVFEVDLSKKNDLPADVECLILTVLSKYRYLLG